MTDEEKTIEDAIKESLYRDVDLSPEEYREKCEETDRAAKANGAKGRAALTERTRHARIELNFYGTVLNFMASLLCEVSEMNNVLKEIMRRSGDNGRRD